MESGVGRLSHKNLPKAVGIAQASEALNISSATLRNWIKSRSIEAHKINNRYQMYQHDVEAVRLRLASQHNTKLRHRANKFNSQRRFVPSEYVTQQTDVDKINCIVQFAKNFSVPLQLTLFYTALNFLKHHGVVKNVSVKNIKSWQGLIFFNAQIKKEMSLWRQEIKDCYFGEKHKFLIETPLPTQRDCLGALYQSCLHEGGKAASGAYYTPSNLVEAIVEERLQPHSTALDPCCGTGQFLLAFGDKIKNPLNIYGFDCDKTAVRIARLNLLVKFKHKNFSPNIFCKNALIDASQMDDLRAFSSRAQGCDILNKAQAHNVPNDFHVVATNPPWGARFSSKELAALRGAYAHIASSESFSYFVSKAFDWLRPGGVASFILPESILNVKAHQDIRFNILKKFHTSKIVYLGRVFKNVFTPVIRLDLKKNRYRKPALRAQIQKNTQVQLHGRAYKVPQATWLQNKDYIFNIQACNKDIKIMDKIYSSQHTTLRDKAQWALGIVTGNNGKFLSDAQGLGYEPVYRGRDVNKFCLAPASTYIKCRPQQFQQMAPLALYRAREKLIYRFISKKLVFAYDDTQSLTLNSANILIPKIPNYFLKVVAALFNSSAYQFIFQKKFSSIKILRNHLEQLPLPSLSVADECRVLECVDAIIAGQDRALMLDDYIMSLLGLSSLEKKYIWQSVGEA